MSLQAHLLSRVAYHEVRQEALSFYTVRAFHYETADYNRADTYGPKFSVHMVVKHQSHMFGSLDSMMQFYTVLQNHPRWHIVERFVDQTVYKKTQLFRMPCCTKQPGFCDGAFDMTTKQNILLPVSPITGSIVRPVFLPGKKTPWMPCQIWVSHLVCSFQEGVQAAKFPSVQSLNTCTRSIYSKVFYHTLPCRSTMPTDSVEQVCSAAATSRSQAIGIASRTTCVVCGAVQTELFAGPS